jgi:hypothetical protein
VSLCSVHIYYGKSKPNDLRRVEEIRAISQALADRNTRRHNVSDGEPENVVLLGDFNIFDAIKDETSAALTKNDFIVPDALTKVKKADRLIEMAPDRRATNLSRNKHFDQIAFHDPKGQLKASCGGVFDFQTVLYGKDKVKDYLGAMARSAPEKVAKAGKNEKKLTKLYEQWRTFQLSDHLPLWVELKTDFANHYLASVMHGNTKKTNGSRKKAEALSVIEPPPPIASTPSAATPGAATKRVKKRVKKAARTIKKTTKKTAAKATAKSTKARQTRKSRKPRKT